jgi:hypothetical protein
MGIELTLRTHVFYGVEVRTPSRMRACMYDEQFDDDDDDDDDDARDAESSARQAGALGFDEQFQTAAIGMLRRDADADAAAADVTDSCRELALSLPSIMYVFVNSTVDGDDEAHAFLCLRRTYVTLGSGNLRQLETGDFGFGVTTHALTHLASVSATESSNLRTERRLFVT